MKLHSGQIVALQIPGFNQVELLEELGSGGDGHVWKVKPLSPENADCYVLKSIRLDPQQDDEQRAGHVRRIRREASVFVDSAYIIKCLGLCQAEPQHFFLLFPYEPGTNLEQWIWENRHRSLNDKKTLFLKILDGVRALHQAQIIHRDLKPKNILVVMPAETPRIFDFGLAKFRNRESVTEVGTIAGTDAYIAHEVFGWGGIKGVDERCDIYALGSILYEMIVGKNSWRANGWDFGDFARFLQQEDRQGVSAYHNLLDIDQKFSCEVREVADVIRLSTMFEPNRRFQSVEQMCQALQGLRVTIGPQRLLDSLPHDGDTATIARQALIHERDARYTESHQPEKKAPERPSGKSTESTTSPAPKGASGCLWLGAFVVLLVGLIVGGLGLGAWGLYRWWSGRMPLQVSTTPTPTATPGSTRKSQPVSRPTRTPVPRSTPSPTRQLRPTATPFPSPAPTSTPLHELDPQVLKDLQKILDGKSTSSSQNAVPPTATPAMSVTPTPEPQQEVNPEVLEELLRSDE